MLIHRLLHRLHAPADEGADLSGDRGDDFEPTDEEASTATARVEAENAAKEGKATKTKDEAKEEAKDDADEEEGDEKEEKEEAKEEPKGKAKPGPIPLERHKQILEKERAARQAVETELANFKKGQAVAATNEDIEKAEAKIVGLEAEYNKELAEGNLDKAAKIMGQIRKASNDIAEQKTELRVQVAEARAYERVRYDNTVDRLTEAYPVLNPDHADYDETVVDEVLELKDAYQLKGYAPADALKKAAEKELGKATARQAAAVETDVKVDKKDVAKAAADERKKAAVKKALDTKQPADASKVGLDSDKAGGALNAKDVIKMPYKEFVKLSDEQLAKMRGDVIA